MDPSGEGRGVTPFVSDCPKCRVIIHGPNSYTLQACDDHRPPLSTPGVITTTDKNGDRIHLKEVRIKPGSIEE